MSSFAIKYPFFILMLCLGIVVVGVTTVARMPVDFFPQIQIPVVVVATFYSGMPPQQIEADITDTFERFFTLGSNIDHIESRSLTGVSLIKVYFQPGTDPDAAVSEIANLAMADLRRLPQGTLPPVVLKFDASSLPVCLVTLKGQGLNETQLHDQGQFNVRNQIASVAGASVPQPYGGKYRQIQFYIDPVKLEAAQLSPMDVVKIVNDANRILPAGDVRIGPLDYNIYSNSQLPNTAEMNDVPLKAIGNNVLRFADIGHAEDSSAIQYNIVRIDGQKSVYLPILKQGGNSNTIRIVGIDHENFLRHVDHLVRIVALLIFLHGRLVNQWAKLALRILGREFVRRLLHARSVSSCDRSFIRVELLLAVHLGRTFSLRCCSLTRSLPSLSGRRILRRLILPPTPPADSQHYPDDRYALHAFSSTNDCH